MCCGAAPTGSVRVACVGVGLTAGLQAEMGVQVPQWLSLCNVSPPYSRQLLIMMELTAGPIAPVE